MSQLSLAGAAIAAAGSIYGSTVTPGAVTFSNVQGTGASTDQVGSLATITTPQLSTSGNLRAGSYTQSASSSLTGADAANYSFVGGFTSSANYTVSQATITGVTGIAASNKTYDGTTAATLNTSTPVFAGQIGSDSLNVGTPSGAFSDRNVANGKTITISGITLGGTDAGNYYLPPSYTTTTTANITQLASVTWVGGTSDNWSNAAKWAPTSNLTAVGAIPDGNNVAAVIIPSGVTVTYDIGVVGTTTLNSLSSAGTLSLTNGSLNIGAGGLSTAGYTQSGGALGGTGNFNVGSSFAQTGGTITFTGTSSVATINQAAGNLSIASLSAPTVNLASYGSIAGQVTAASVTLIAGTGIGSSSAPLQLVTSSLSASTTTSTSGGIYITNTPTAAVTLNSLTNAGLNSPIAYVQNGQQDLTIIGSVSSNGGSILIDPPTNLTMTPSAVISSGGGTIGVQSLGNIVLAAINAGTSGAINLSAGGSVSAVTPSGGGPNLIGGTATLAAGGNVDFSAQVQTLIATGVLGSYTITDAAGAVLFSGSGTAPTTVQQLITTVLPPANNTSGSSSGTSIISLITNNVLIGGTTDTGLLNLLYATSPSIGGIVGTFGGSDFSTLTTTESGQTGSSDLQGSGTSGSGTGTSGSGGGIDNSKGKPNAKPNKC